MKLALMRKTTAAEPFRVPSLAEASPEYATLLQKQADLLSRQSELNTERRAFEKQIAAMPSDGQRVSSRVAELLGDPTDSSPMLRKRSAEIRGELSALEEALEVIRRRLTDAKGPASSAICQTVRPEYGRRVAAVAKALEALALARADYDDLKNQFEAEDVAWSSLIPLSLGFLGDPRDGQIPRFMREVKEAGYVN